VVMELLSLKWIQSPVASLSISPLRRIKDPLWRYQCVLRLQNDVCSGKDSRGWFILRIINIWKQVWKDDM